MAAVAATKTRPSPYVVVRRSVGIVKPYWQVISKATGGVVASYATRSAAVEAARRMNSR